MALVRIVDAYCPDCGRHSDHLKLFISGERRRLFDPEELRGVRIRCSKCGQFNGLIATEPVA